MGPLQAQQFLTILKHMNLTKAANELYISQSALSQSLARLETELGLRLFYRDGSRLILSREGEVLQPFFQQFLNAYDTLLLQARSLTNQQSDAVKIGYSGSALRFAAFYMTDYFGSKSGSHETVLLYATRPVLETMLLTEQIDIAITYPPLSNENFSSAPLSTEKILLAVPTGHPLAGRESVSMKELSGMAFAGSTPDNHFRSLCDELCLACGLQPNYALELDYQSLYQAIGESAGGSRYLFFCPEDCFEETFGEGYCKVALQEKRMSIITSVAWLTKRKTQLQYKDLIDYITASFTTQEDYHAKYTGFLARSFRSSVPLK